MRDLVESRARCCYCDHVVLELLDDVLPQLSAPITAEIQAEIDGARVAIVVEIDHDSETGAPFVVGPVHARTKHGGLITRRALEDLGFGAEVLDEALEVGR